MSCLILRDTAHDLTLQTCSQPTFVPSHYVMAAQDQTPADYPLRWAGLAVTIGQVSVAASPPGFSGIFPVLTSYHIRVFWFPVVIFRVFE